jgi:hypothetical protein
MPAVVRPCDILLDQKCGIWHSFGRFQLPREAILPVQLPGSFFPCNHITNIKKKILFPAKQKTA